jgi:L-asparaginase II
VAVVNGRAVWASGPSTRSPWRSAAKPLQLWCALEALGDPALPAPLLAIGASSHSGQDLHLETVRAALARLEVSEAGLLCGAEPPAHRPTHEALIRRGDPPRPIHNDCSGKHAFMLGACRARGWSAAYRPPSHPLQRRIAQVAADWTGDPIELAIDGCGVPVLCLSVAGMARAWARMAEAMAGDPSGRLGRIGGAMAAHPHLTSGDDRIDMDFARGAAEPFVGKIGAQGVFCVALPARRMGIAVKAISGHEPALAVAVAAALAAAAPGAWRRPDGWRWHTIRDVVGDPVGRRVVSAL